MLFADCITSGKHADRSFKPPVETEPMHVTDHMSNSNPPQLTSSGKLDRQRARSVRRSMRFTNRLLVVSVAAAVSGCKTLPPPPQPYDANRIRESGGAAYLWTAGKAKQSAWSLFDFAVVIGIDDRTLSPEYRPSAGQPPFVAWRMEVPPGRRFIVVLDKEVNPYCPDLVGACVTEKEIRVVEFTAEVNRVYMPLASDKCGRKWIWIADAGPGLPDDPRTQVLAFVEGLPTVGGENPPAGSCE